MHLLERCLSVLGCRYVDEVIIGAPWEVTKDMVGAQLLFNLLTHVGSVKVNIEKLVLVASRVPWL